MEQDLHTINGKNIDLSPIKKLISEGQKKEAVMKLCTTANASLTESIAIVKILKEGSLDQLELFRKEVVRNDNENILIKKSTDKISVFYIKDGEKIAIDPKHKYWDRVKDLTRGNASMVQFEANFIPQTTPTPSKKTQQQKTSNKRPKQAISWEEYCKEKEGGGNAVANETAVTKDKVKKLSIFTMVGIGLAVITLAAVVFYFVVL